MSGDNVLVAGEQSDEAFWVYIWKSKGKNAQEMLGFKKLMVSSMCSSSCQPRLRGLAKGDLGGHPKIKCRGGEKKRKSRLMYAETNEIRC